jgi:hypothetical protein
VENQDDHGDNQKDVNESTADAADKPRSQRMAMMMAIQSNM